MTICSIFICVTGNMDPITTGQRVFSLKKVLSIIFISLFIFMVMAQPLKVFLTTQDIGQTLYSIGEIVFASTKSLADESKAIIEAGDLYKPQETPWLTFKFVLLHYIKLISSLGMILLWLSIFNKGVSLFSSQSSWFFKSFLSLLLYYFLNVLFLLGFYGLQGIDGISGSGNTLAGLISLPVVCFYWFFKALPVILAPLIKLIINTP